MFIKKFYISLLKQKPIDMKKSHFRTFLQEGRVTQENSTDYLFSTDEKELTYSVETGNFIDVEPGEFLDSQLSKIEAHILTFICEQEEDVEGDYWADEPMTDEEIYKTFY